MSETARILIVDDERNIRFTLAQAIASSDRSVVTAMNGEEALHCLEQDLYQVILLDLQLPGMSGLEILREIRRRQESARVVIVTAHGNIDNAVEAMKLGAADFLQKPLVPEQVRSLVNRLIHQRAAAADPATDYFNRIVRARQLMADGLLEAAELEIRGAIACDPDRPAGFNLLGAVHERRGEVLTAIQEYRAALALAPGYEPAQRNLERLTTWPRTGGIVLDEQTDQTKDEH